MQHTHEPSDASRGVDLVESSGATCGSQELRQFFQLMIAMNNTPGREIEAVTHEGIDFLAGGLTRLQWVTP